MIHKLDTYYVKRGRRYVPIGGMYQDGLPLQDGLWLMHTGPYGTGQSYLCKLADAPEYCVQAKAALRKHEDAIASECHDILSSGACSFDKVRAVLDALGTRITDTEVAS